MRTQKEVAKPQSFTPRQILDPDPGSVRWLRGGGNTSLTLAGKSFNNFTVTISGETTLTHALDVNGNLTLSA